MKRLLQSKSLALMVLFAGSLAVQAANIPAPKDAEKPKPAIELGAPFADNAILQRQMDLPVWGWSKPGTKVTVAFAGQKKSATTDKDGKWMLKLAPLKASFKPAEMLITESTGKKVTLKNILVGEVWMASGQSNMQWLTAKSVCKDLIVEDKNGVAPIRECKVTNYFAALHPIEHATGVWKNGDYLTYSAIAFAFAHKLYEELGVPIGILNCSFSQTAIQAWTPRVGYIDAKDDYSKALYLKTLETDPSTPEHKAAWDKFYQDIENTIKENAELVKNGKPAKQIPTKTPGNLSGNRDATWLFNARLNPMIPCAIRGAIWNQGYANMGEGLVYYNNLHSLIRGWRKLWDKPELPVYFHQFYCPRVKGGRKHNHPSIGSTAEMRAGTWLARDIPHANMASQIDIEGAIHYQNKAIPGQRLALHALKNQYGKKIVADGPMFKSYKVEGNKLIIEFDHAEGGLVVAETQTNSKSVAVPTVIPNGADKVGLFSLAGEDRIWHPATVKIEGNQAIVTSAGVKAPRGVSYGTGGIGFQPNLYNKALLPTTPFIFYDHKMVTAKEWPHDPIQIAGVVPDPNMGGKVYAYRKMPLLSTQFRDNAVFQSGVPVTIFGSAVHDWGHDADGEAVIKFSFAGVEKTIPVIAGMKRWQVVLPAMKPSAEPKTLKVTFTIDGEVIHERTVKNVVIGDVWYVATPNLNLEIKGNPASKGIIRVMQRKAKGGMAGRARPYSVCVSTTPLNRFASIWADASGSTLALGQRLASKSGNPVGIIIMQGTASVKVPGQKKAKRVPLDLKHWIPNAYLKQAPSLMTDYKQLATINPGNDIYDANAKRYMGDWKKLWGEYIPQLIATKKVPDGAPWGRYPSLPSAVTTDASQAYYVMTHSFGPASLKGILFLCSENMFEGEKAANYGAELSALANGWKNHFGGTDTPFFYTMPAKSLSAKAAAPKSIKGKSAAIEISAWADNSAIENLIDTAVKETSK